MKAISRSHRGCPVDYDRKCFAYKADGRLCQEPAEFVDPVRGCYVCAEHKANLVRELTRESVSVQEAV